MQEVCRGEGEGGVQEVWVSGEGRKRIAGSVGVREKEKGMSRNSGVRERKQGVCRSCQCQGEGEGGLQDV